jgi:hypothetical protein
VPVPVGTSSGEFGGIACNGLVCEAVGDISDSLGNEAPLAEKWNGTSWTMQSIPLPGDATTGFLSDVSCPTATDCTAVGTTYDDSFNGSLTAEVWNGTNWATQAMAQPADIEDADLEVVSCTSAGACMMSGNVLASQPVFTPFSETRSGITWSSSPAPKDAHGDKVALSSVWCSSATSCVGASGSIYAWNGTGWSTEETDSAVKDPDLGYVTCRAAQDCVAIGTYSASGDLVLIEAES